MDRHHYRNNEENQGDEVEEDGYRPQDSFRLPSWIASLKPLPRFFGDETSNHC